MRVILSAENIPEGSTVTKVTGSKEYTLVHRIEVYQEDGSKYTMACKDGARFITADGIATAIGPNAELVWHVDPNDLIEYIESRMGKAES